MLDLNKKFIFTHPPKCGGTSIEDLIGYLKLRAKCPDLRFLKHASLEMHFDILKHNGVIIDDFFKFTIIRNPWDRAVSYYNHVKYKEHEYRIRNNKIIPECFKSAPYLSFKEYIFKEYKDLFSSDIVTKPYMFFQDKFCIDYVIRLENLKEDLYNIKDKIQIDLSNGIPHLNNSNQFVDKKNYKNYYDEETKIFIQDLFKWDIETFGYKF